MTQEIPTRPTVGEPPANLLGTSPVLANSPELADVVDALEAAADALKTVVKNKGRTVMDEIHCFVRERPMASLALSGGVGYLLARLNR